MAKDRDNKIVCAWNSAKGRTMENWNWLFCGHGPSSVV